MPFDTRIVGQSTAPMTHQADARWLMAYAAGLQDYNPRYMDTGAGTVVAHPLFPVCVEWPVILSTRSLSGDSLTAEESSRGVHAAHDLHIYQPIRAGDELRTTATLIGAQPIKPGAAYTMQLDTIRVSDNVLVARTFQLGIYRNVAVVDERSATVATAPQLPDWRDPGNSFSMQIPVAAGAAHTYTECARIWNPIHTDRAVALAAGLPDIILHGTATMALAVSRLVNEYADGDPTRITRIGGRFSAMVLMPSTITLQACRHGDTISYQVLAENGDTAISHGFVVLDQA